MKINNDKDIEILDQKIKTDLGVDVRKYRNDEVVETFVSMLVLPEYVLTWMIGPLLLALVVFGLGFLFVDLVHVQYAIYGAIGLVLFFLVGLLGGILLLTGRMKQDLMSVLEYSINMVRSAAKDVKTTSNLSSGISKKESFGLLFKGIIHIVTIPTLTQVLSLKIPIVGGIIGRFAKKILTMISNTVHFEAKDFAYETDSIHSGEPSAPSQVSSPLKGVNKVMNVTFGVARFPFKLMFFFTFILLLLFIWLIH